MGGTLKRLSIARHGGAIERDLTGWFTPVARSSLKEENMDDAARDEAWYEQQITRIENRNLETIIKCETVEAVEAALGFAAYLNFLGMTPENYPVFLMMLEVENHWVVDALIGDRDPFTMMATVQPSQLLLSRIFAMMGKWSSGGIYPKNLSVILGVLQRSYVSPEQGFMVYPVSVPEVNSMGKHLDKAKGQENPVNRAILDVLGALARLSSQREGDAKELVARQADAIRNAFFDERKQMKDVIPDKLLTQDKKARRGIQPRKTEPVKK